MRLTALSIMYFNNFKGVMMNYLIFKAVYQSMMFKQSIKKERLYNEI
jgi:hypothetical protein